MRRNRLLLGIALLVAALSFGAVACGDTDDDNGNGDPAAAEETIGEENGNDIGTGDDFDTQDAIETQEAIDIAEILPLIVSLVEEGGSGVSGQAGFSVIGNGILATLAMSGLSQGTHPNHLYHGSCAEQGGEIHVTLDNIVADETGAGIQSTNNDEQPLSHYETGHYLAVHESLADLTVVACGDVVSSIP